LPVPARSFAATGGLPALQAEKNKIDSKKLIMLIIIKLFFPALRPVVLNFQISLSRQ
jgi:hypothetical protein